MIELPVDRTLLIRTDFTDDAGWLAVRGLLEGHARDSGTELRFVEERAFDGRTPEQLGVDLGADPERSFAFVADASTLATAEHPVLVVDLADLPGRAFRVVAPGVAAVQEALELSNISFDVYLRRCDEDGVFRG
ncbi:DUF6924 domain-containing protein [Cryptosporangium arvum]|uniref:DUF6924 domain-containing protein n=1 Tax=Cryptosporangium arvum DSM 44712 TaxID=927661 RepID=A0A010Z4K5_9ACTN|nr:hypothetical protein [Cryptosporangium arvum]EXG82273.1 hypothetical protein CryarDRAFT_3438 [Cryptosporangium arvum DSM 44712]